MRCGDGRVREPFIVTGLPAMSYDPPLPSLTQCFARTSRALLNACATPALVAGAAALLLSAGVEAAPRVPSAGPANVCPALTHIVDAASFTQLRDEPAALPPGVARADDCRASAHAYDCHWQAHWGPDGVVNDPLEELGADIAACFSNDVHDLNTPTRQHFVVTTADARRVSVTASVVGTHELRLLVTR
jgi:hypothetical protein